VFEPGPSERRAPAASLRFRLGLRPVCSRRAHPFSLSTPVCPRSLALTFLLGCAVLGWATCGPLVAASFGAGIDPVGPAVPVMGILDGLVVAIDPGHGGVDQGFLKEGEVYEGNINLAVSLRLAEILERSGACPVLTRTDEKDVLRPGDLERWGSEIRASLGRRVQIAMDAGADIFISIHCNAFPASVWRGSQTFYMPTAHPGGKELAEAIQTELVRVTSETERMANGREDLFVIREMNAPAVVVELGFLSNPRDYRLLLDPDYQQLLAMAIFFGVCRYVRTVPPV